MPIKFDIRMDSGVGNLGRLDKPAPDYSGLANLDAAFIAGRGVTADGGGVSEWASDFGHQSGAKFVALSGTRLPENIAGADLISVLRFARGNEAALRLEGMSIGNVANYSFVMRVKFRTLDIDFQSFFGGMAFAPSRYRLIWRPTSAEIHFQGGSDSRIPTPATTDWMTIVVAQGGGEKKLSVNGSAFAASADATTYLPELFIGGLYGPGMAGADVDFRAILLLSSDISSQPGNLQAAIDLVESV